MSPFGIKMKVHRHHATASRMEGAVAGRGTFVGQTASDGQFSENQTMISSYLRAVKERPDEMREKKLPSFAASRPTVDSSKPRAAA